jgi:hypothetical protein
MFAVLHKELKMNERINELLKQSRTEYWTQYTPSYDYEKFAELIVNQCADIAQQHNKSPVAAPLAIGYVIRRHFGVRE